MAADSAPTHFELFDLPQSFDVDRQRLEARYRELQREAHPDRFAGADDRQRRLSMQQATRINEAYRTLGDPLLRGRYLLELAGYSYDDEHHTTSDTGFLMEQMELRDELSEVPGSDDAFGTLGRIMQRIDDDLGALERTLATQLEAITPDRFAEAAGTLVKMQFFRKLQDEAVELEVRLEDELA